MNIKSLRSENFGRYKLSDGQFLRSNEYPGEDTDIIIHKNQDTLDTYSKIFTYHTPKSVFEIGVKEGGSLVLWSTLFDCKIVGVDNNIKQISAASISYFMGREITVIHADCFQLDIVNAALRRHFPEPIDLIIDDCGTHTIDMIKMNFKAHYHKLSDTGLYIIEDWYALHEIHRKELLKSIVNIISTYNSNCSVRKYDSMIVIVKM